MNFKKSALAVVSFLALVGLSTQANASTWTVGNNSFSTFASTTTVDFGIAPAVVLGTVVNYESGLANYSKGAFYNTSIGGVTARPVGSAGNFWSVGTSPSIQNGPGLVTFDQSMKYYGFLWGSSDSYNTVTFSLLDGNQSSTVSLTGLQVPSGTGNQAIAKYLNFFATGNEVITGVSFVSNGNAFETDNHAYSVTAVPEVETYAMMLAGLGLTGTIVRRRKIKAA